MPVQDPAIFLLDWIAKAAAWCAFTLPTIQLITATVCAGIGILIILLRREALAEESWVTYFARAFLVFAFLQYGPQAVANWTAHWWTPTEGSSLFTALPVVKQIAHALGSVANNLLFLACALALFGHKERKKLFPFWARGLALTALVSNLCPDGFWQRVPDALFSAICLTILGWAMYVNFSPHRRKAWALLNVMGGLLYGLLNILYAFNILIAHGGAWSRLRQMLEDNLQNLPVTQGLTPLDALDALVFAVAFPFKILLFLSALLLIMKCLTALSPREAGKALELVKKGRVEYLSDRGIVRALGESVAADLSVLCFRLPGKKENRLIWWRWLREPERQIPNPDIIETPDPHNSIVAWVLSDGKEKSCTDRLKNPIMNARYWKFVPGMRAFLTVPIVYQGTTVACLNLEWKNPRSFTATAIQRIRMMADLLAPAVHARQQLTALDLLNRRLHQIEISRYKLDSETLTEVLGALQNVLAPAAIGIWLTMGFRRYVLTTFSDKSTKFWEGVPSLLEVKRELGNRNIGAAKPILNRFNLRTEKKILGMLTTAIEEDREGNRLALVGDRLHRKVVASMVAATLVDIMRHHLNSSIARLQTSLSSGEIHSLTAWYEALRSCAQEVGLLWLAARIPTDTGEEPFGESEEWNLVRQSEYWPAVPVAGSENLRLLVPGRGSAAGAPRIVHIALPDSRGYLWAAVASPRFGRELRFDSPWLAFLRRLAQAAEAALVRIEQQRLEAAASKVESVATRVELTGLLMHELRNQAIAFSLGVQGIENAVRLQNPKNVLARLAELKQEIARFAEEAEMLKGPTRTDGRHRIPLLEAVQKVCQYQIARLMPKKIRLEHTISSDLVVVMPFDIVFLALIGLVTNAAAAIGENGRIEVTADVEEDSILCHVTDDGPGIPGEYLDKLFTIGFTTRSDGSGLGLYLARSALRRRHGDLLLEETARGRTRFTLRLPKFSKENKS